MTTDELRDQHAEIGSAVTKLISERAAELDLLPVAPPATPDERDRQIAAFIVERIPDGATLQVGIGGIPNAVLEGLQGHRDLGIHSALFDSMLPLLERGVVTGATNRRHPGCLALGEIMGTEPLFRWVHENPRVYMEPSTAIHDPRLVAGIDRFVSINSAIEIDLTGQVNAEAFGERQVAGIGGQFDFVAGAALGGGRSVIALPSTGRGGEASRIVARLGTGTPVTTPRHLVDCVVTEFGRAELRGLSDERRARELTRLAHPRFREGLEREWRTRRQVL
jgi:4-hydroxybutyrate CoA-transferase